jgi:hypothetical protein
MNHLLNLVSGVCSSKCIYYGTLVLSSSIGAIITSRTLRKELYRNNPKNIPSELSLESISLTAISSAGGGAWGFIIGNVLLDFPWVFPIVLCDRGIDYLMTPDETEVETTPTTSTTTPTKVEDENEDDK